MPLDPQAQALLELTAEFRLVPNHQKTAQQARADTLERTAAMRELGGDPEPLARVEDRVIPGPGGDLPVRIYTPEGASGGCILYFHGGGWVICNLDTHDGPCRALANLTGSTLISVDYRLAPEAKYPAAAEDSYAATCWASEHAAELGIDASRIAVAGDSAGGNLAAVVAQMARDRGGPALAFQVLVYPVTDRDFSTGSYAEHGDSGDLLSAADMTWYWDQYLESAEQATEPYAAPLQAERPERAARCPRDHRRVRRAVRRGRGLRPRSRGGRRADHAEPLRRRLPRLLQHGPDAGQGHGGAGPGRRGAARRPRGIVSAATRRGS